MSRSSHERRLRVLQTHVVDPLGHGTNYSREGGEEQTVDLHEVQSISRYVDWGLIPGVLRNPVLLIQSPDLRDQTWSFLCIGNRRDLHQVEDQGCSQ